MLQGKGLWIWNVSRCEGGDPQAIARVSAAAAFDWVALKVADGAYPSNRAPVAPHLSLLPPVAAALRAAGLQVWGWQYVYGDDWQGEAAAASRQAEALALDGFIIDAEAEYKRPGREAIAARYLDQLRAETPGLPLALSSYRYPTLHPEFPWDAFLSRVDLNMPQVYWEGAHDPADELARSVAEFDARAIRRPVVPVAPVYRKGDWAPTAADICYFRVAAGRLRLSGWSFFSWDECRRDLPDVWAVVGNPIRRIHLPLVERGSAPGPG
jgi:hypothetical protein